MVQNTDNIQRDFEFLSFRFFFIFYFCTSYYCDVPRHFFHSLTISMINRVNLKIILAKYLQIDIFLFLRIVYYFEYYRVRRNDGDFGQPPRK